MLKRSISSCNFNGTAAPDQSILIYFLKTVRKVLEAAHSWSFGVRRQGNLFSSGTSETLAEEEVSIAERSARSRTKVTSQDWWAYVKEVFFRCLVLAESPRNSHSHRCNLSALFVFPNLWFLFLIFSLKSVVGNGFYTD